MNPKIITTTDGSHSLYVEKLNEHYHSIHGAVQESNHVFIEAGLKHLQAKALQPVSILEIGLGTALNALLTLLENQKLNHAISYTAIEAFPLDKYITSKLNFTQHLNAIDFQTIFTQLHSCKWGINNKLLNNFLFLKIHSKLQDVAFNHSFDLVYFDAFAPTVQPELWTETIFSKIYAACNTNALLVTYCAKGEVKRTLKKVGFEIESIAGPPGKREMIRAIKK